jgi:hypothetical protein
MTMQGQCSVFRKIIVVSFTFEALVLLADEVFDRDPDVLEGDVGCSTTPYALAVHLAGGDTAGATLNEENTDTIHAGTTGTDGGGEVVTPNAVGNPFLFTVDNVVLAIFGKLGFTCQIRHIAARI